MGRCGWLWAGVLWAVAGGAACAAAGAPGALAGAPQVLAGAAAAPAAEGRGSAARGATGGRGAGVPADSGVAGDPGASGVPVVGRVWPVGVRPAVVRGWDPPATPYGPGHRGVDLAAPPGAPVRTVAAGRVSFAGRVAGRGVVSVELPGTGTPPLRTTYEPLRPSVKEGDEVRAGDVLGTLDAPSHCAGPCLHWGLRKGDTYLNPLALLPPSLTGDAPPRLLPVLGVPVPVPASAWKREG